MPGDQRFQVCVVGGAGYVGLITGVGMAQLGHQVINVDRDPDKIALLQQGKSPVYEQGLEPLLKANVASGRLSFSTDLSAAVAKSKVIFVAVGTPSREDGHADLSQVIEVAEEMVGYLEANKVVVIKSTVPVGTVELVLDVLRRSKEEGRDFDVVCNPEFLREGKGLQDFFQPARIVIGASSTRAQAVMRALYEPLVTRKVQWPHSQSRVGKAGPVPFVETDLAAAQMIKYASNAFLAARISFINEIAGVCDRMGVDIKEVVRGIGFDPRIGHGYLEAGLGFGGPCLGKDLLALIKIAEARGYEPMLLRAVLERNDRQVLGVVTKLKQLLGDILYRKTVAVFGLAFKAGTNDIRNSPAPKVLDVLEDEGAIVRAHDPIALPEARAQRPDLTCLDDPYEAVQQADALLILTEWPQYRELDYKKVKALMAAPRIVDARNLLDPAALKALGFQYLGIGRP